MAKLSHEDLTLVANTIRGLSMDAVQAAKSGHPGMPMGMADVAAVLWLEYLKQTPDDPNWPDRDRFALSAGHGSMLLYSLLHLAGYDLPLDELKRFRQWNSRTPGHPEYGETPGVETTTGPLAQGSANGVGMALAERMLAARFNDDAYQAMDHHTYVIAGDGCMMEGLSHEAFSLAGHLGLSKLIVFYDDNRITIEGSTDLAYSDDPKRRFQAYHWNVIEIDAHDYDQIRRAIRRAKRSQDKPTVIICHSHIGYGSPNKQGTASAHGEPLGEEEIAATKRHLGMPEEAFHVPAPVRALFAKRTRATRRLRRQWERSLAARQEADTDWAQRWRQHMDNLVPADLDAQLPAFAPEKPVATRSSGGTALNAIAAAMPQLVGGAADLAPSTKTLLTDEKSVGPGRFEGRNLHFGVREHAMGAIMNGMALHGGFRVFGATFFVFADYCRPAIRLAAIMKLPVVYVFTHDSYNVGEDGPTHQPVEHLASLRCIPGLTVIRPADATESAAAWAAALRRTEGPTALILTRQNLPVLDRTVYPEARLLERGAYVLWQSAEGEPDLILIASGSEVAPTLEAARELANGLTVRVVTMPSWECFDAQPEAYRETVLPSACQRRVAVEAGVSQGWERYVGPGGRMLTLDHFGRSGPYQVLAEQFGFTPEAIAQAVRDMEQPV